MVGSRAVGLLCNDPQRGHLALHQLADAVGLPQRADAIGVASVVDGAALLSRLPAVHWGASLAEAVGPIRGRCSVIQVRVRDELRPNGSDGTQNLGPFRARTFAAAVVGGPQDADAASASRERLLSEVPEFLRRVVGGRTEAEALFIAILARLHARGALDAAHERGEYLAAACQEALEVAAAGPRHVVLTNGVILVHVARGMPSALLTLHGLTNEAAQRVDATLVDSSTGRERLRRFRAVLSVGALDAALKATSALPSVASLQVLPDVAAAVVQRDLSVKLL